MDPSIRILIVDDHESVREALRLLLAEEPSLTIVGEATSGQHAIELAVARHPDVVLMDLVMPGMDGLEAIRRLRGAAPGSQVLVLTSYANDRHVHEALAAGAVGYLLKDILKEDLLQAINSAHRGQPTFYLGASPP